MIGGKKEQFGATQSLFCRVSRSISWLAVTALILLLSNPASAQRTTGTLRGQVLDPAGAVVPDVPVTITNQETGVSIKVTTTSAGTYAVPSLIPGLYKVSVEAKGFKSFLLRDVNVSANQDNVADAKLDLGVERKSWKFRAAPWKFRPRRLPST